MTVIDNFLDMFNQRKVPLQEKKVDEDDENYLPLFIPKMVDTKKEPDPRKRPKLYPSTIEAILYLYGKRSDSKFLEERFGGSFRDIYGEEDEIIIQFADGYSVFAHAMNSSALSAATHDEDTLFIDLFRLKVFGGPQKMDTMADGHLAHGLQSLEEVEFIGRHKYGKGTYIFHSNENLEYLNSISKPLGDSSYMMSSISLVRYPNCQAAGIAEERKEFIKTNGASAIK